MILDVFDEIRPSHIIASDLLGDIELTVDSTNDPHYGSLLVNNSFILKIKAQKHLCKHWFMIPGWSKQPPISWLNSLSTLPICTSVSSCVHTLNIFAQSWLGIFHFTLPSIPDLLVISIFVSFQEFSFIPIVIFNFF